MGRFKLEIIVFISGAVVMIFELVGSRVLAPHLGSSIFTWTSIIGVILGSLSLGYWLGGKLADRKSSYAVLAIILLLAGIFLALMNIVKESFLIFLTSGLSDIRLASFLASVALFALPSILLGTISPYAVKLKINNLDTSGSTVGNLYAISTLGSIVGTFLAGFWLIPVFGITRIIYILALVLGLISLLAALKKKFKTKLAFVFIFAVLAVASPSYFAKYGVHDFDTQYSRILIYDHQEADSGRPVRSMLIDNMHSSAMFLDGDDLVFDYFKFYHQLSKYLKPELKKALLIGGAGYVYPRHFLQSFPEASLEVVEIDPRLTDLAREYFFLKDSDRLRIHHEDGRMFLNENNNKYDLVMMDAVNSLFSIPYQLTTREAVTKIYQALEEDGLVMVNMINVLDPEKNDFLRAEYSTYKSIFPQVYIFPVKDNKQQDLVQNFMLVASKSTSEIDFSQATIEQEAYLSRIWLGDVYDPIMILTDEYAPVDYYMAKILPSLNIK